MAVRINYVQRDSLADRLGLAAGAMLYSVDGNEINDVLDYRLYTTQTSYELAVMQGGRLEYLQVENPDKKELGCLFESCMTEREHHCANHCIFCMADQLPQGLNESLYCKDDDKRLSFLDGNYVTLTNLSRDDINRIIAMKLSPINVSVHTTNPDLRCKIMGNERAGEVLCYLEQLAQAGIQLNLRLVLCKDINDGEELDNTLRDLVALHPAVRSISAVPCMVTRHREGLPALVPYDAASATETLTQLERWGIYCKQTFGERIVYPTDAWYFLAGKRIPHSGFYQDLPERGHGVGEWRALQDSFLTETLFARWRFALPHKMDVVCGVQYAVVLSRMLSRMSKRHRLVEVVIHPVMNETLGAGVYDNCLIAGQDIIAQCAGNLRSKHLGVPETMLWNQKTTFVDGVTVKELEKALDVKVHILPGDGTQLAKSLLATHWL